MGEESVLAAYEAFAPIYNEFNHLNDYEMWLGRVLLPELEKHGLKRGRVLDVACGTGRAFAPLLKRGWEIQGCDLSPAMLERAREQSGDEVDLAEADMRELPVFGEFELIISLNDPVNYLFEDGDLERTFAGMRSNLADDGLVLFDCNTLATFRSTYATGTKEVEYEGRHWTWRGVGETASGIYENMIEGDDIEPITHRERHRSEGEVREAMAAAGLDCLAALGMTEVEGGVELHDPADEQQHFKVIYIGAKAP
ncbi:MAG TPA: class I SAM-dependent methyltransferase [Solirubrobacterales bacterium]|nr:class I SAM-dependent methyltransferase [Solirubrobacterales bacterium]